MQFVTTASPQPASGHLVRVLNDALDAGQHVLLLLSGGSVVDIAVQVRKQLTNTAKLVVMQVDERYGPIGHPDSNWQKLLAAGFDTTDVVCHPILTGKDIKQTTTDYDRTLGEALANADRAIGLFGIGADGHTAGMLPGSSAARETTALAATFHGPDFERITITTPAIAKLNLAVAYAVGEPKFAALKLLAEKDLPIAEQPAQALKQAQTAYVYTDYKAGGK